MKKEEKAVELFAVYASFSIRFWKISSVGHIHEGPGDGLINPYPRLNSEPSAYRFALEILARK